MGKNWDKALVNVGIWQECLRVLKPGAFALGIFKEIITNVKNNS